MPTPLTVSEPLSIPIITSACNKQSDIYFLNIQLLYNEIGTFTNTPIL